MTCNGLNLTPFCRPVRPFAALGALPFEMGDVGEDEVLTCCDSIVLDRVTVHQRDSSGRSEDGLTSLQRTDSPERGTVSSTIDIVPTKVAFSLG